jgi:hypothetical protein
MAPVGRRRLHGHIEFRMAICENPDFEEDALMLKNLCRAQQVKGRPV